MSTIFRLLAAVFAFALVCDGLKCLIGEGAEPLGNNTKIEECQATENTCVKITMKVSDGKKTAIVNYYGCHENEYCQTLGILNTCNNITASIISEVQRVYPELTLEHADACCKPEIFN